MMLLLSLRSSRPSLLALPHLLLSFLAIGEALLDELLDVLVHLKDITLELLDAGDEVPDGEAEDDVFPDDGGSPGDGVVDPLGLRVGLVVVSGSEVAKNAKGEHVEELLEVNGSTVDGAEGLLNHLR